MTLEQELREIVKARAAQDGNFQPRLKRLLDRLTTEWKEEVRHRRAG